MPKLLTGAVGTGDKIMQNINLFYYTYTGSELLTKGKVVHKFDWSSIITSQELSV